MKSSILSDLATVFEKMAKEEECRVETASSEEKPARGGKTPEEKKAETHSPVKEAADAFHELTGVTLDPEIATKLATDSKAMDRLLKLAAEQRRPETLGGPSDRTGVRPEPRNGEERLKNAYDRFGEFLLHSGHTDT